MLGYFVLAFSGLAVFYVVAKLPPSTVLTWMLVVTAGSCLLIAFGSLARSDSIRSFGRVGTELLRELNVEMSRQLGNEPNAAGDDATPAPRAQTAIIDIVPDDVARPAYQ
jgi:hypothetical protein